MSAKIYKSEESSQLNKKRAERFLSAIDGQVTLDKFENAWCFGTSIESNKSLIGVDALFFEGAVAFRVFFDIPEILNNDIFKKKILKKKEDFRILDKYIGRIVLLDPVDKPPLLVLNISYLYYDEDCYDMDKVGWLFVYIAEEVRRSWEKYIDSYNELKSSSI